MAYGAAVYNSPSKVLFSRELRLTCDGSPGQSKDVKDYVNEFQEKVPDVHEVQKNDKV